MLNNFTKNSIITDIGKIIYYKRGDGPPVLLLHGYPQFSLMWEESALLLSQKYTTIIPDLRGYGESAKPKGLPDHSNYSKRAMANDLIQIMDSLKYQTFSVVGHDRGGRVAHRLARDYKKKVIALSVLDICPTLDMYELTEKNFAKAYFHWFFLIQPKWLPERMIKSDPRKWMKSCLDKWSGKNKFGKTEEIYFKAFKQAKRIHATCEDYRAAATIDLEHDKKDRNKKLNIPIQVLWGKKGVVGKQFNSIKIWQKYTNKKIYGAEINSDHFIPEESPKQTINHLKNFFLKNVKNNSK